jgi:NADPH:quinone reductase-like Zn-dependent oxidoreductase
VAKSPANLNFNQAGSLPLVGVSALQALKHHIALSSGQKIFIHGGGGGIGTIAIQIAKSYGAYVATTVTGEAIERVKQLGADETIDYKAQDFVETLSEYDAVFDTVGGGDFDKSLSVLKKGGIAVSMTAHVNEARAGDLGITAISQSTHVTTAALNELTKLVEDGMVTPDIGEVFPLLQIKGAFEAREAGGVQGKIVIEIR